VSGTWISPNVPTPQDWVLVMQAQKIGETVTLPEIKVGQEVSGKLEPAGATFTKVSGAKWLTIEADGSYSGIPGDTHAGKNSFLLSVKEPGDDTEAMMQLTIPVLGAGGEIFSESFGGYQGSQNAKQADTKLNVAYQGKVSGWMQSGRGAMHAVDRSFGGGQVTPSDWAIMIFDDNVITSPLIEGNQLGQTYRVAFQAAPAVYAQKAQATTAKHALLVEVLREDGSVLKRFTHSPGAWDGKAEFVAVDFEFNGDDSGPVRLRIGTDDTRVGGGFAGAVDNVVIRKVNKK
jgi:hypothetical protein